MSTQSSAANLAQALKELHFEWQQTEASWQDHKAAEFHSRFLDPLPAQVARATNAIQEIHKLLSQARSDCE
ncbi:MAG: hypothetical protein RLZZ253_1346 [Verrucomicrobiota bacterium]|jgi:hypothetical protein